MPKIKEQIIQLVQALPDDVMAELYFKLQVDTGLKELAKGKEFLTKRSKKGCLNGCKNKMGTTSR